MSTSDADAPLALDCEMVLVEGGGSALARCCIVSYDEEVRLDSFAAPPRPVTDYLTRYSGIRAHDLEGAPAFEEVRARVAAMIDGRTIVGHGLHNDLRALQLTHPKEAVVDTASLDWGAARALSLKALSLDVLGEPIQRGGHSPHEDAIASLRLLKAHRQAGGAPPPSQSLRCRLRAVGRPSPPGCEVDADDEATAEAGSGAAGPAAGVTWVLRLPGSRQALDELIGWYADSAEGDGESHSAAPLLFEASMAKERREAVHKAAQRLGLSTQSCGIGGARALRILPRGQAPAERPEATRAVAALVFRWSRAMALEAAEPVPFSHGEVEEIVEAATAPHGGALGVPAGHSLPPCVPASAVPLVRRALAVLPTAPPHAQGELAAWRARCDYERTLALHGRIDAARLTLSTRRSTGGAAGGGRKSHQQHHHRGRK